MKNPDRWQQRFDNFEKAFSFLKKGATQEKYNLLEEAGLVQTFEFTFELAWKTLKDKLILDGFDVSSPKQVLRTAFQAGYLNNETIWLDALENRNLMAHTYAKEQSSKAVTLIKSKYLAEIELLYQLLKSKLDD